MAWLIANAAIIGALLYALPSLIGDFWAYTLALYFLYAIACLGVGLGAYLSGLILIRYIDSEMLFPLLIASALIPGLLAYVIGRMIFHGRSQNSAFFALITLGLVLLASQIATSWNSVTGGYNGLRGIPGIPGMDGFEDAYTLSAVTLAASALLVGWIIATPLGVLWRAVALDERRVAFLGFNHNHLKSIAFGLSGLLGGVAGTLYAPENNLVTPDLFGFVLSTNFVVWVAIGGRSTLYGPILGAIAIGLLTASLRESISYWEVVLAVMFILSVLYFQKGIVGLIEPVLFRWFRRFGFHARNAPPRKTDAPTGLLQVQALRLSAGTVKILNDLELNITNPGIYCLIGPNGAGKTTVFNAITGEMQCQSGRIEVLGRSGKSRDARVLTCQGLGRKFQIPNVFDDLTIGENLAISLWTGRARWFDLIRFSPLNWTSPVLQELQSRFSFLKEPDRSVGSLSHGQRQILDLVMVLCMEPRLILLDEPCAGLSPSETEAVIDTIQWATQNLGATALIIEHDMALVRTLADHVFVLSNGHLLAEGTVSQIQDNDDVKSVYSGGTK